MGRLSQGTPPRVLGLTGPIGCGKTTVGNILLQLGAVERIDADVIVHELLSSDPHVRRDIDRTFGTSVLTATGTVDRRRLADIVFSDPESLEALERILHPAVRSAVRKRLQSSEGVNGVIILDAVKLLQSDLLEIVDAVWLVRCDVTHQMDRLTRLRRMDVTDAEKRLSAQPSFQSPRITYEIENSSSEEDLYKAVSDAWGATLEGWGLAL